MKKILTFTMLFFLAFQMNAQETETVGINWVSFEKAADLTKENPKPLLISVFSTWCGWCKKMDKTTYQNTLIINYINDNFYAVKLDGEGKDDIKYKDRIFKFKQQGKTKYNEFAAALLNGKLSYPTTVFMNKNIDLLDRIPGYLDTKMMEKIVTFFGTKKYETVKWEDFVKNFKSSL